MPLITAAIDSACWRTFNGRKTWGPVNVKLLPLLSYALLPPGIRCGTVMTTPAAVSTPGIAEKTLWP
ncbi:hypothetical protein PIB30_054355 [Stylosanthes scabra]|uniref:Uncharacterized protein n=1 Tax=Stylosanthes scabra TaxID=79078 RepID=A0ABU6XGJ4_9FABA|nr:hypothetical protein [Stylosanthes scabra]